MLAFAIFLKHKYANRKPKWKPSFKPDKKDPHSSSMFGLVSLHRSWWNRLTCKHVLDSPELPTRPWLDRSSLRVRSSSSDKRATRCRHDDSHQPNEVKFDVYGVLYNRKWMALTSMAKSDYPEFTLQISTTAFWLVILCHNESCLKYFNFFLIRSL